MYLEWIVYFSVLMVTLCKSEKDRNQFILIKTKKDCPENNSIRHTLREVLGQLEHIATVIEDLGKDEFKDYKLQNENNISYYLENIALLLKNDDDNDSHLIAFICSSCIFTIIGFWLLNGFLALSLLCSSSGLSLYLWINRSKTVLDELKYSLKRTLDEIKNSKALESNKNTFHEMSVRIKNNIVQAKCYLEM